MVMVMDAITPGVERLSPDLTPDSVILTQARGSLSYFGGGDMVVKRRLFWGGSFRYFTVFFDLFFRFTFLMAYLRRGLARWQQRWHRCVHTHPSIPVTASGGKADLARELPAPSAQRFAGKT